MTVPPYAVVFVGEFARVLVRILVKHYLKPESTGSMFASWISDKYHLRGPQVVIYGTLGIIGYGMALSARADQTGL